MAPVTDASQGKVQVFDPQEIVRGETIAQWTENWWQWAFQAPANGALGYPAPQPTHGKIFFIGANEGPNAPPVHATINVPTGMPILLPMINAFDTEGPGIESDPGFKGSFADEAKFVTQLDQAAITNAFVTITKNGQTLLNLQSPPHGSSTFFAELSGQFAIGAPQPGSQIASLLGGADISTIPDLPVTRSAGDWLMLGPLRPGTYEFHFGGSMSAVVDAKTGNPILPASSFDTTDTIIVGHPT
jgi:hypothetical protein